MKNAALEESGLATAKINDLISRLNDVKYGASPPSSSAIEAAIALAEKLGLDTSHLIAAAAAAEKATKEATEQTKITPTNALEESEKFFKSPEMKHILNMQQKREEGATFDVNGKGKSPCISQQEALNEAKSIDRNYLSSQRMLKELDAREQEIFNSRKMVEHEVELDKILTQRINHAKLQANHDYRKETGLTNEQLYSTNEIGTKTTKGLTEREKEAELGVISKFEERMNARKQKLGISTQTRPVTQNSFKNLTVEHINKGTLLIPRSTPNVSQARSQTMLAH